MSQSAIEKEEVQASFTCSAGKLQKLINETALEDGSDPYHDDIYLRFLEDRVQTLVSRSNNSAMSFCTFGEPYFDSIRLDGMDGGYGAIIRVERILDYLDLIDSGTMNIDFVGRGTASSEEGEEKELASFIRLSGGLNVTLKLPVSSQMVNSIVPLGLTERFDDDNRFLSSDGGHHTTFVQTTFSQLEKIRRAVELDPDTPIYPIVIRDEEFRLELGVDEDEIERAIVDGALAAESVEGDEVSQKYNTGFEEVTKSLSGDVEIQVSQGGPMVLVQVLEGQVNRYILAPTDSGQ